MAPLKLGVLVPSSNTSLEPLTSTIVSQLSPSVSVHFARFAVTEISLSPAALAAFDVDGAGSPILAAARLLADAQVDVIGWSGTSGGWLGFEHDEALCAAITAATGGIPATTSTLALNRALGILAAGTGAGTDAGTEAPRTFALVTPYRSDVQAAILANYAAAGYEIAAESHLGRTVNVEFAQIDEATLDGQVRDVVSRARQQRGEGLLAVSTFCTNLSAAQYAAKWEREHGVPVLDTVSTVVWDMLRITGHGKGTITGWGSLFAL